MTELQAMLDEKSAEALREAVRRIDMDERAFDGFGSPISNPVKVGA